MLPKKHRLNLNKQRFFRGEIEYSSPFFKILKRNGSGIGPKIGFIISGKVGKAVTRNKIRRLLAQSIINNIDRIPKTSLLILIAFPKIAGINADRIEEEVNKGLLKLFNNNV